MLVDEGRQKEKEDGEWKRNDSSKGGQCKKERCTLAKGKPLAQNEMSGCSMSYRTSPVPRQYDDLYPLQWLLPTVRMVIGEDFSPCLRYPPAYDGRK
jgi:hypothetical protein